MVYLHSSRLRDCSLQVGGAQKAWCLERWHSHPAYACAGGRHVDWFEASPAGGGRDVPDYF